MTHAAKITKPVAEMSEDEFTEWLCALPPPPEEKDDDDDDADDAAALADLAEGRCYDHETVGRWLKTAGDADFKPIEEWLAEQNA